MNYPSHTITYEEQLAKFQERVFSGLDLQQRTVVIDSNQPLPGFDPYQNGYRLELNCTVPEAHELGLALLEEAPDKENLSLIAVDFHPDSTAWVGRMCFVYPTALSQHPHTWLVP